MDVVLLVHGAKHARLEDMSFSEPAVWLQDRTYEVDEVIVDQKRGDRVGTLGYEWRNARRASPALFYRSRQGAEDN